MKRSRKKLVLRATAITVVSLLFVGWIAASVKFPMTVKLVDCSSPALRTTCTLSPGENFQLVLGVPRSTQLPPSFRGRLALSDAGGSIVEYPIGSDDMRECNWLNSADLQGYILTWRDTPALHFGDLLRGRHTYEFSFEFSEMPPQGSALWITWLQRGRD